MVLCYGSLSRRMYFRSCRVCRKSKGSLQMLPTPTSRVGDMIPTHPVQWLLGFPPPPRAGERAICVPRVSGLGARHGPFPCTLPPAPSQDLDRNPQERSQAQLGLGTTLGVGVGMGVGLYIHPAPPLFCSLQSSLLCQQGPCDMSVTRGGSWGFQSSPSDTCHLSIPISRPLKSPVGTRAKYSSPAHFGLPAHPFILLSEGGSPTCKGPSEGKQWGPRHTMQMVPLCSLGWRAEGAAERSPPCSPQPDLCPFPLCSPPKRGGEEGGEESRESQGIQRGWRGWTDRWR